MKLYRLFVVVVVVYFFQQRRLTLKDKNLTLHRHPEVKYIGNTYLTALKSALTTLFTVLSDIFLFISFQGQHKTLCILSPDEKRKRDVSCMLVNFKFWPAYLSREIKWRTTRRISVVTVGLVETYQIPIFSFKTMVDIRRNLPFFYGCSLLR